MGGANGKKPKKVTLISNKFLSYLLFYPDNSNPVAYNHSKNLKSLSSAAASDNKQLFVGAKTKAELRDEVKKNSNEKLQFI